MQCVSQGRHVLAEGAFWCEGRLWWVDIKRGEVWSSTAAGPAQRVHAMAPPISAAVPARDGRMVLGGRGALHVLDRATGAVTELVRLPGEADHNRCNEMRTDPWGNLWIGTMDEDGTRPTGALWRLSREGELRKLLDGVIIANTLAWDPRRRRLYFADSGRREIYVFDAQADSAELANPRVFLGADAAPGVPDGSALDDDGCLWNARWDGGCLVRVSPAGDTIARVAVPARRPTSCAFGAGRELYVTTALPDDQDAADMDGQVMRIATPLGGQPGLPYAGPLAAAAVRVGSAEPLRRWPAR